MKHKKVASGGLLFFMARRCMHGLEIIGGGGSSFLEMIGGAGCMAVGDIGIQERSKQYHCLLGRVIMLDLSLLVWYHS